MKNKLAVAAICLLMALPTIAAAERQCVTNEGYIGAIIEADFDRLSKFLAQKDTAAAMNFIASGKAFFIKGGVPVIVDSTKIFSGKVCLRIPGNPNTFWTNTEAIKCTD